MKKLPSQVYIKLEKDGDTSYLVSSDNVDEMVGTGETVIIGVYELIETRRAAGVVVTKSVKQNRKAKE